MGFELFLRWQKLIGKNNSSFTLELEKILLNNSSERSLEAAQDEIKDILDRFWNDVLYRLSFHELENSEEVQPWIEIQIILSEKVPKLNFTNYHYPIVYQAIKDQYFHEEKGLEPSILINLLTEASILAGPITPQATKFYPLPESDNNPKLIKQLTLLCYLIHCQLTEKQKTLIPFLIHFRPTINSDELKIRARKIVNCLLSKETLLHFMFTDEETNQIMASSIDKETHSLFQLIALVAKPPQTVSAIVIALNKILQLEELPPNDCLNFSNQLRTIVDIFAFNVEKKSIIRKGLSLYKTGRLYLSSLKHIAKR
ncbi:MAG: hypothetical protein LCH30_08930 [Proteobacteria bacterium]|nr:hypothetical protein [Pseudomonadota bacterium]